MENYDSSSCYISSDDEDDYVPLVSFQSSPLLPLPKVIYFSCYFCPKSLKFLSEKDVHLHMKKQHPHVCKNYSFSKKTCRLCNMALKTSSFRGLISHVVEKKCESRVKAELKRKKEFLGALSLCSVSNISDQKRQRQPLREPRSCVLLNQKIGSNKKSRSSSSYLPTTMNSNNNNNSKESHQQPPPVNVEPVNQTNIYGSFPLPQIDPSTAVDYGRIIPPSLMNMNANQAGHSIEPEDTICTSFLCSLRDKEVLEPCSDCKEKLLRQATKSTSQQSTGDIDSCLPLRPTHPTPNLGSDNKKSPKHQKSTRPPKINYGKQKSNSQNSQIEADVRDLYNRAISAGRLSAINANLKNCSKTVRKVKRLERRQNKKEKKQPVKIRRESNEENAHKEHDVPKREKLLLKVNPELWLKVLHDINTNSN